MCSAESAPIRSWNRLLGTVPPSSTGVPPAGTSSASGTRGVRRLGPFPDTTMAISLEKDVQTAELPALFGGTAGRFVQHPASNGRLLIRTLRQGVGTGV